MVELKVELNIIYDCIANICSLYANEGEKVLSRKV